jgi:hypothetical protein
MLVGVLDAINKKPNKWFAAVGCLALTVAIGAGCGSEDSEPDAEPALPGKLTFESGSLAGVAGKVVVVFVLEGNTRIAGACLQIAADPDTVSGVALAPDDPMGNPCLLGAEATIPAGTYDVSAGIYVGGETVPEQCSETSVVIDGDTTVLLPAFGACS